jgi:phospholipid/cholesterol/gamma-HCH transport system substrate-binding protein
MAMLKLSPEAKVGLFVFIGIILLVYMSLRLGGFRLGREEGYDITVRLDSVAGLDRDASVRIAGVEVGRVKDISLEENKAKLTLRIDPDIKVGKDFTAVLKTQGLLGEKYLELLPGSPDAPVLEEGGEITRVTTYTDMDALITILSDVAKDIKKVSESLGAVIGGKEGETTLRNIVKNIEDITFRMNRAIQRNDDKLDRIMTNLDEFSKNLKDETPKITEGLKEVADNLNEVIQENRDNLKSGVENLKAASHKLEETIDTINRITEEVGPKIGETATTIGNVAKKLDEGEGTLGKLINDPTVHENLSQTLEGVNEYLDRTEAFRFFIGYRGEYLHDPEDLKSYYSLKIQPREDKYYLLEVVDDPRGDRETEIITDSSTGTTREVTTTTDDLKFSIQIAKRFWDFTLRGGLIENTGGAGVDYNLLDDRLVLTLEAFDFEKERNPHLKAGATFHLNKYFFLTAGYDDFISRVGLDSAYFGLGFQLEDDDLKFLFSNAPPVSF